AEKRSVLAEVQAWSGPVTYLAWDFESRPLGELPDELTRAGHDPGRPTLTIWEGVTMYLSEPAIEESFRAVRAISGAGSGLVMTYFDRDRVERPTPFRAIISRFVALRGEPFRFGWLPAELPAWARARGFDVEWDRSAPDLARELL